LDTTRVIERLTQARLSRFHSTGVAAIQQASSNLDTLLHPQQSTRRPQMIIHPDNNGMFPIVPCIHLNREVVDTTDARAVMDHVRGRILATTVAAFVCGRAVMVTSADVPGRTVALFRAVHGLADPPALLLRLRLDLDAMVWHNLRIPALLSAVEAQPEVRGLSVWEGDEVVLYVASCRLGVVTPCTTETWTAPLPALSALLCHHWPCIADVFCAESSSVYGMMRLPLINKSASDTVLLWAGCNWKGRGGYGKSYPVGRFHVCVKHISCFGPSRHTFQLLPACGRRPWASTTWLTGSRSSA
jgi:hypothetical protein